MWRVVAGKLLAVGSWQLEAVCQQLQLGGYNIQTANCRGGWSIVNWLVVANWAASFCVVCGAISDGGVDMGNGQWPIWD